jgi:hypothetical protein
VDHDLQIRWLWLRLGYPDATVVGSLLKRNIFLLLAVTVVVTACGDGGLFDGLGDRSVDYVHGETTSTTTTTEPVRTVTPQGTVRSTDLLWINDNIEGEAAGGQPSFVISTVWGRGDGVTSVIQASRVEIATALPGIQFPELVPDSVGWVTSQMVYDVASGLLSPDTAAQFGLWHKEPYTSDEGRTAVIRVRRATSADVIGPIAAEDTATGLNLSWVAESYYYVIECPLALLEENCYQMAESVMPLSQLLPAQE